MKIEALKSKALIYLLLDIHSIRGVYGSKKSIFSTYR